MKGVSVMNAHITDDDKIITILNKDLLSLLGNIERLTNVKWEAGQLPTEWDYISPGDPLLLSKRGRLSISSRKYKCVTNSQFINYCAMRFGK